MRQQGRIIRNETAQYKITIFSNLILPLSATVTYDELFVGQIMYFEIYN